MALSTDPAYFETRNRLRQLADEDTHDACCTQCGHLHDMSQRRRIMGWEDDKTHTECPACYAWTYYDLTLLRN